MMKEPEENPEKKSLDVQTFDFSEFIDDDQDDAALDAPKDLPQNSLTDLASEVTESNWESGGLPSSCGPSLKPSGPVSAGFTTPSSIVRALDGLRDDDDLKSQLSTWPPAKIRERHKTSPSRIVKESSPPSQFREPPKWLGLEGTKDDGRGTPDALELLLAGLSEPASPYHHETVNQVSNSPPSADEPSSTAPNESSIERRKLKALKRVPSQTQAKPSSRRDVYDLTTSPEPIPKPEILKKKASTARRRPKKAIPRVAPRTIPEEKIKGSKGAIPKGPSNGRPSARPTRELLLSGESSVGEPEDLSLVSRVAVNEESDVDEVGGLMQLAKDTDPLTQYSGPQHGECTPRSSKNPSTVKMAKKFESTSTTTFVPIEYLGQARKYVESRKRPLEDGNANLSRKMEARGRMGSFLGTRLPEDVYGRSPESKRNRNTDWESQGISDLSCIKSPRARNRRVISETGSPLLEPPRTLETKAASNLPLDILGRSGNQNQHSQDQDKCAYSGETLKNSAMVIRDSAPAKDHSQAKAHQSPTYRIQPKNTDLTMEQAPLPEISEMFRQKLLAELQPKPSFLPGGGRNHEDYRDNSAQVDRGEAAQLTHGSNLIIQTIPQTPVAHAMNDLIKRICECLKSKEAELDEVPREYLENGRAIITALEKTHELETAKVLEECDKQCRTFVSICANSALAAQKIIDQAERISRQLKSHLGGKDLRLMVRGIAEVQNDIRKEIDI